MMEMLLAIPFTGDTGINLWPLIGAGAALLAVIGVLVFIKLRKND
jgi:LPXTG-motif cell wall-anchored protein